MVGIYRNRNRPCIPRRVGLSGQDQPKGFPGLCMRWKLTWSELLKGEGVQRWLRGERWTATVGGARSCVVVVIFPLPLDWHYFIFKSSLLLLGLSQDYHFPVVFCFLVPGSPVGGTSPWGPEATPLSGSAPWMGGNLHHTLPHCQTQPKHPFPFPGYVADTFVFLKKNHSLCTILQAIRKIWETTKAICPP